MSGLLSRIGEALTKGQSPPLQEVSSSRYEFFHRVGNYTNPTSKFIVVLGYPATVLTPTITLGGTIFDSTTRATSNLGNQTISVSGASTPTWGGLDPAANPITTIDLGGASLLVTGVQASTFSGSKKMLLPPGFTLTVGVNSGWFGVLCRSLDDALAIL